MENCVVKCFRMQHLSDTTTTATVDMLKHSCMISVVVISGLRAGSNDRFSMWGQEIAAFLCNAQ